MLYSLGSQPGAVDISHAFHLYYSVVCGLSFSRSQPDFEGFLRALRFPPSSKLTPSLKSNLQDLVDNNTLYWRVILDKYSKLLFAVPFLIPWFSLSSRGYDGKKLSENVECEIMQTILEEARDSYKKEIVNELQSNTTDELENNLEQIEAWIQQWSG